MRWPLLCCLALAAASLLVPSAPTYDPWAWLIWGREIAHGELSTAGGPAWKPLPVAVTALLSPLGSAAPDLWLVVARAGALAAVGAAFVLARRLVRSGGEALAAGAGAALAVALCDGFVWHAAVGNAEGLLLALGLVAAERLLAGRPRQALALGLGAALLRPEAWPFLVALAAWVAWRDRAARPLVVAALVAVPLVWIVPEWLGSGDPWRSSERARIPNSGAPALSQLPALESLHRALAIPVLPTLLAVPALVLAAWRGRAPARLAWPALAGVVWVAVVAAMAQLGYSGEERYMLPGAALVALSGGGAIGLGLARAASLARSAGSREAVAAARLPASAAGSAAVGLIALLAALAVCAPFVVARTRAVAGDVRAATREARLFEGLDDAVAAAGGRAAILRCGRPYTGPLRGPAVAWHLGVVRSRIGFAPRAPGVALVSRLPGRRTVEPRVPAGFAPLAAAGGWRIVGACRAGSAR